MTQRLNYMEQSPELTKKFLAFSQQLTQSAIEQSIIDLVVLRASQMNGCTFCIDMHVKEAKIHGERELRVHHVAGWRESTLFAPRERAALAWTEALTQLEGGVGDEVYAQASAEFSEQELLYLTSAVASINVWNRFGVAYRWTPPPRAS